MNTQKINAIVELVSAFTNMQRVQKEHLAACAHGIPRDSFDCEIKQAAERIDKAISKLFCDGAVGEDKDRIKQLETALMWYADTVNYIRQPDKTGNVLEVPVLEDRGTIAKNAIAGTSTAHA